ncbi:diguanylate cyclase [Vibrio sp. SCSIO 43136]|uniref:diguanylate cyclase domain-containing protein n=1 Tax=Vibrio sp. SCSIO 43136 TaxID=2819101 RepID=UPI0020765605|nr:diguanylate cyclase [Vibrio sp. SCSIO 43136]USD66360.1 diguanylate cyclase [Vibrio sp. SCSIO 43136]
MNHAKWLSMLTDAVRHLPTKACSDEVLQSLEELQVLATKHNQGIPLEYQAVFEAYAQYREGDLVPAMKQFFDCVALCHSNNQEYLVHFSYFCIGTIFGMLGDQFHASEFLTKAENIHTFQDDILYALTKNNIGDLLLQYEKYEEALVYFDESLQILSDSHHLEFSILPLINSANVHVELNQMQKAQKLLESIKPKVGDDERYLSFYYQVLAHFHQKNGDLEQCEQSYLKAIKLMSMCHHTYYESEMILEYCQLLLAQKRTESFDAYLEKGLQLANLAGADKLIDGFNDQLVKRMELEDSFDIREKTYKLLIHSYQKSRDATKLRETSYLKQIYQLNMDRLKLELAQDINSNLSLINNIGQYISTCNSFEDIIVRLGHDLSKLFIIDSLAIAFYDPAGSKIRIQHYYEAGQVQSPVTLDIGDGSTFFEYCATHDRPLYFNNMTTAKKRQLLNNNATHDGQNSVMFSPITINGKVEAIFTMQAKQCFAYQTFHYELFLQLSSYLSIAIENQLNRQKLTRLSQTDHLTQVWNRQSLDVHFADMLTRHPERLSVLMIDIDCYKQFNDHYGHIKGDETLIAVTKLICKHFPWEEANTYRYGGDEFVVVVHDLSPKMINHAVAALQDELYERNLPNKHSYCADRLSLSIGAAHIENSQQHLSLSDCLHKADMALYQAKRDGRNKFVARLFGTKKNLIS